MELVFLLIIGVFAGVVAGLFGIGGGVIIVPALIYIMNFPLIQANGTSLAALLLPVGIFAVLEYHKSKFVDIKIAFLVAIGLALGVTFGAEIALILPPKILRICYGIFLLYVSFRFIEFEKYFSSIKKFFSKNENDLLKKNDEILQNESNKRNVHWILTLIFGVIAGIMSGMFGIGGGLIIVPFLLTFMKFSPKEAIGTSLAALLLPVGLPGVMVYYNSGNLNLLYAAPVALGIVLGSIFGAKISISLPSKKVKLIYGYFVLIMALDFILL